MFLESEAEYLGKQSVSNVMTKSIDPEPDACHVTSGYIPLKFSNVTFLVRGTSIGTGITSARRHP